ncbi:MULTISPECIES: DUF4062 domain-containing protein [Cellulosimicrobium]|uniref:DUF4062 domain-containing protein n=1 Tax=Cellulosimicrobium TaxID=157920 RepID=UPI002097B82B|nr:DUF4062 domain-containing protein [Cellulosimicrobium cellulans]MCO7274676.1 DUF4062 domain-containing protein [Cellulosimicrobium cellulans]
MTLDLAWISQSSTVGFTDGLGRKVRLWVVEMRGRRMSEKKYQIFVSSTFEDLKEERDVVIKAILEMGHIPVGMEMFSAADEEQWKIIERHIEESDYYCVIVAHRYGSIVEGVSFTRKEYEYAVSCGVPVLGFVIDDSAEWPPAKIDRKNPEVKLLGEFKDLVRSKPVSFWKSADDLYGRVSISLSKAFTANPREGWSRGAASMSPETADELTRLSAENARLRNEISKLEASREADQRSELNSLIDEISGYKRELSYKYSKADSDWSDAETNLLDLFHYLSSSLLTEVELMEAAGLLAMELREDKMNRAWWIVAKNQTQEVLADLMALGLVEPSRRRHGVSDKGEYWSVTSLGVELHNRIRLRNLKSSEPEGEVEGDESAVDDGAAENA